MTKRKKREWLEAIHKLTEYYLKYQENDIPVFDEYCPFCKVCRHKCVDCLWVILKGGRCLDKEFWKDTARERVVRLRKWEQRIMEGENDS